MKRCHIIEKVAIVCPKIQPVLGVPIMGTAQIDFRRKNSEGVGHSTPSEHKKQTAKTVGPA